MNITRTVSANWQNGGDLVAKTIYVRDWWFLLIGNEEFLYLVVLPPYEDWWCHLIAKTVTKVALLYLPKAQNQNLLNLPHGTT